MIVFEDRGELNHQQGVETIAKGVPPPDRVAATEHWHGGPQAATWVSIAQRVEDPVTAVSGSTPRHEEVDNAELGRNMCRHGRTLCFVLREEAGESDADGRLGRAAAAEAQVHDLRRVVPGHVVVPFPLKPGTTGIVASVNDQRPAVWGRSAQVLKNINTKLFKKLQETAGDMFLTKKSKNKKITASFWRSPCRQKD